MEILSKLPSDLQGYVLCYVPTVPESIIVLVRRWLHRHLPQDSRCHVQVRERKGMDLWFLVTIHHGSCFDMYLYVRPVPSILRDGELVKHYRYFIYPCGSDPWYHREYSIFCHCPLHFYGLI